jgi:hypothetical protein
MRWTCTEYAIVLGVLGALIIFLTATGVRKVEISQAHHNGVEICQ